MPKPNARVIGERRRAERRLATAYGWPERRRRVRRLGLALLAAIAASAGAAIAVLLGWWPS